MTGNKQNGDSDGPQFKEDVAERYLLGELAEAEQEEFETAYFTDDAFLERFLSVKNEMLDLYSRGELAPEVRSRIENHFLTTEPRRKRLVETQNFIRDLTALSGQETKAIRDTNSASLAEQISSSWFESVASFFTLPRLVASAGTVLAVFAAFWFINQSRVGIVEQALQPPATTSPENNGNQDHGLLPDNSNENKMPEYSGDRPRTDTTPSPELAVNAQSPNPRPDSFDSKKTPETPGMAKSDPLSGDSNVIVPLPTPKQEVVAGNLTESVTLDGSTRSATKGNTANIGPATRNVSIRLRFSSEAYPSYSVRITSVGGAAIWQAANLKASMTEGPKTLNVTVPANLFTRKDYIVILNGRTTEGKTETIREYYFHVVNSRIN